MSEPNPLQKALIENQNWLDSIDPPEKRMARFERMRKMIFDHNLAAIKRMLEMLKTGKITVVPRKRFTISHDNSDINNPPL